METNGDSTLVDDLKHEKSSLLEVESVEFERRLDNFEETLEHEEKRLMKLEERRVKILRDIEALSVEIAEEKKSYRKAIDNVIAEHEKVSLDFIKSCKSPVDVNPINSSLSLVEACAEPDESTNLFDLNIELESDLTEMYVSTKSDYLTTIKDHLKLKKMMLECKNVAETTNDSA